MQYSLSKDGFTQGLLLNFMKCRVFTKLTLEGWTPRRVTPALQFGTMAHEVLETVYKEGRIPEDHQVVGLIRKMANRWEKENPRAGAEEIQQLEMNATLLEATLPLYFRFWGEQDFKKVTWVALEEEFSITMFGGGRARGKWDGIKESLKHLVLFETKTKGQVEKDSLYELLEFDFQTNFYILAGEERFKRLIRIVQYNIIRRPLHKQGVAERLQTFGKRVANEIGKRMKEFFIRYRIVKSEDKILQFKKELEFKFKEFKFWTEGKLPTYKNENSCVTKFGTCAFLSICAYKNYSKYYKRDKIFPELGGSNG